MFKQHGGVAQLQAVAFGQQAQVCRAGISRAEEKIAVAVLVVHRARQGGEGGGNTLVEGAGEVVAEPVIIEIAEDVNRFSIARDGGERIEKGGGNRRPVFGEVNVGEEVDGHERT